MGTQSTFLHPDAAILNVWGRRKAAYEAFNSMPEELASEDGESSPEEVRLWAIMDNAELFIRSTVAKTLAGAEIQVWAGLLHSLEKQGLDVDAINRRDLDHFTEVESGLDWRDRLSLAVIRSLRAMEA